MVKFDLLLLPLIGGYIFLITSYFAKFYHQRLDRQRLIFNSVIASVLIEDSEAIIYCFSFQTLKICIIR